jgi:hypothetical protein
MSSNDNGSDVDVAEQEGSPIDNNSSPSKRCRGSSQELHDRLANNMGLDTSSPLFREDVNMAEQDEPLANDNDEESLVDDNNEEPLVNDNNEEPLVNDNNEEPLVDDNNEEPLVDDNNEEPLVDDNNVEPLVNENNEEPRIDNNQGEQSDSDASMVQREDRYTFAKSVSEQYRIKVSLFCKQIISNTYLTSNKFINVWYFVSE